MDVCNGVKYFGLSTVIWRWAPREFIISCLRWRLISHHLLQTAESVLEMETIIPTTIGTEIIMMLAEEDEVGGGTAVEEDEAAVAMKKFLLEVVELQETTAMMVPPQ